MLPNKILIFVWTARPNESLSGRLCAKNLFPLEQETKNEANPIEDDLEVKSSLFRSLQFKV
eukprot:2891371-Amphidinium_carterae.1